MAEGVDARVVLIAPGELQRVVSDLLDVAQSQISTGDKLDDTSVALAMRTGTISAQYFMRQDALVPISPLNLHDLRAVRCFDARGLDLGITRHVRLPLLAYERG